MTREDARVGRSVGRAAGPSHPRDVLVLISRSPSRSRSRPRARPATATALVLVVSRDRLSRAFGSRDERPTSDGRTTTSRHHRQMVVDAGARDANGDDDDDDDAVRVDDARALFERCRVAARALERAAMSAVSNREKCSTLQGQADATSLALREAENVYAMYDDQ